MVITMKKRFLALALALTIIMAAFPALAAIEATADKTTVQAGDTVMVTLTVTGDKLSVAQGTFTYDASLLAFEEGAGGASDGRFAMYSAEKDGAKSLSASITFTASGEGSAKIDFTLESLLDYSGKTLDTSAASVDIAITPAPTEPLPAPIDYSAADIGVKAQNVQGASEDMFIWRSIENITIPSRYSEADIDYHGEMVGGAQVKDSDAPTLVYLSNAKGESAGYYIFDTARDMLYPYKTLSSVSKSYIILEPDGTLAAPTGFEETSLTIDEKEYKAWVSEDAQGSVYLIYARNPSGEIGYYYYNQEDESLQRYAVLPARPVVEEFTPPAATPAPALDATQSDSQPAPEAHTGAITPALFYAVCGLCVVFLGLFIFVTVKTKREKELRRQRVLERKRREAAAKQNLNG